MPITTQFCGNVLGRAARPADPDGYPLGRWGCQQPANRPNPGVLFDERPDPTFRIRAPPAAFPSPQSYRLAERRQIHQHHAPIALRPHRPATRFTGRAGLAGPDHHLQRCIRARVVDPYQINLAQVYQLLAYARRTATTRGPPASDVIAELRLWRTPPHFWWVPAPPARSPSSHSFPKSRITTGLPSVDAHRLSRVREGGLLVTAV